MSEALVELRGVQKAFGTNQALAGVDLDVAPGEIVGFVGPNGAGKTTCLRVCVGILQRDAGSARVLGFDPSDHDVAIRRRCTYLPGETSMYRGSTGRQFLDYALGGYAVRTNVVGELFDLPLGQRIREYSSGMKQRLALRAVLSADVDLYILDEPDRALDTTARVQLRDLLFGLRDAGKGILLSSHHLTEVEAAADRTVFVLDGECVPDERIERARARLRSEVRLQLSREIELPDGVERVERRPDGGLRVRTSVEPLEWLARLPSDAVAGAEVGATRLEDLYAALTDKEQGGEA